MSYKQLDFEKRCSIKGYWDAGYSQTEIARRLGAHKSTISRELNRNITFVRTKLGSWQYKPGYAQRYTDDRHKKKNKNIKFTPEIQDFVRDKIKQEWSPEQICGYAKKHGLFDLSHEWIYQFILRDKEKGGTLHKHLRHQTKKYRKRYGSPKRTGPIKDRVFIDERPSVVDDKNRIGDWEIDTIIGKNRKQAVVTVVERVSKKAVLRKVCEKTARNVTDTLIVGMKNFRHDIHTITSDSGSEFAYHKEISAALKTDFYFAHPYSSWERGLNENTNGLVRQYLKKGSAFENVTDHDLENIMDKLNNRPRRSLGYRTPNEVFYDRLNL